MAYYSIIVFWLTMSFARIIKNKLDFKNCFSFNKVLFLFKAILLNLIQKKIANSMFYCVLDQNLNIFTWILPVVRQNMIFKYMLELDN